MRIRIFFITPVLILFSIFTGYSQPAETNYLGSVARAGSANNAVYGPFNIGFDFTFFENTYSQFYINSNGQITFGEGTDYPLNSTIPDPTVPNNFIAPFWDDLTVDASGNILYTTIGAAPNRKLIVQFRNMGFYGGPIYMGTFFVILYETSGVIHTQYRIIPLESATRPHGESATIGLENIDGSAGSLYRFNNSTAISSWQAISFTPSDGNYTIDSNAAYDGVYLTTNLTLPEPGITSLISPAENAVIGPDPVFQWSASTNAASYSLKISTNSSLSGATSYNAGSNLSYSLTGLIPGTIYYWGVFATNATGTTWGQVKKFTVSTNPPLAAVPQTVFVEQNLEKTIKLNYTGGDASLTTAIITALPAQGKLFQYNAGVMGNEITTVPTTVSDAAMNVIYDAPLTSGNGIGNFSFRVHDNTGDSPIVLATVNVSPPGIPNLLYVAKSPTIEMQFDRLMANPTGKHLEFTATVNGFTVAVSTLSLKTGDNYSIIATLTTPLVGGETVLISYSAGTITSAQGGWLASFTDQPVTLTAQTITFTQSLDKKYSDSPFALTASAPGGAMTYSSSNPGVATALGSVLTFHALGSSDITARQAGDAAYAPAKFTRTLSVDLGDQTITFGSLPPKNAGDADFSPGATASSGLPVSYSSSNSAVATIVSGLIHIVGGGTSVIRATQSGNSLYNGAIPVEQTLTITDATSKTLYLNYLFLEGLYDGGGTMRRSSNDLGPVFSNPLIADQITVELHNSTYSLIAFTSNNVNLSTTGTATISIPSSFNESYYITIKHRNHIETTTSSLVSFSGNTINYAFDLPSKFYGANAILFAGTGTFYAIYGGDVNQNGLVESIDMTPIDNLSSNFGYGYNEDVNCDGIIDSRDMTIVDNNNSGFVSSVLPL